MVHSITTSPLQKILPLRGEWDFVTDPQLMGRHRMGKGPGWNEPDWTGTRKIQVPGCWEAQGVGEPGMSRDWGLPFDCIPRPLNHVYMGTARYRRSVSIPPDWNGNRIWLKVGGVRTEAWFWVNRQRVAHLNTYCGSYKYDITDLVKAGQTTEIVAIVRNDTPSRKGCMAAFHRFGGFYRDIELEATPTTRLDDVWVRGDVNKKTALVNVSIRREGGRVPPNPTLEIVIHTLDGQPRWIVPTNSDARRHWQCRRRLRSPIAHLPTMDAGNTAPLFGGSDAPLRKDPRSTRGRSDSASASWKCMANSST